MTSQPLSVNCLKAVCTYQWVRSMICVQRSEVWVSYFCFGVKAAQDKTRLEISESFDLVSIAACLQSSIRMVSWWQSIINNQKQQHSAAMGSSKQLCVGLQVTSSVHKVYRTFRDETLAENLASILTREFSIACLKRSIQTIYFGTMRWPSGAVLRISCAGGRDFYRHSLLFKGHFKIWQ